MTNLIPEFKKHLQTTNDRKLTNVQMIVEFYIWYKNLDKKFEPFTRHLRAAKKIDAWANGNLDNAFNLIIETGSYMDNEDLNYTLDTIVRNIPNYQTRKEVSNEIQKALAYEEQRSKERLAEFHREQEEDRKKAAKKR